MTSLTCVPVYHATAAFDRRWSLERCVKEIFRDCGRLRQPARFIVAPLRPGGAYREIRFDGRKYYEVRFREFTPKPTRRSKKRRAPSFVPALSQWYAQLPG